MLLGELIGVNYLKKAFDYKNIILESNESYELGICAGLVVIRIVTTRSLLRRFEKIGHHSP